MSDSGKLIEVLVVDDSAVVRQTMLSLLTEREGFHTTIAPDPIFAQQKMTLCRPDVILLDLEMPRMDGLTFIRKIMSQEDPVPVVICSALIGSVPENAVQALLDEGAVDVVTKPFYGVNGFLVSSSEYLMETLRGAAGARLRRLSKVSRPATDQKTAPATERFKLHKTTDKVVAIGASTGGTDAIRLILESMPPDAPGIVIVQHMPEGFTGAFAKRLNETCAIEVKEAETGDRITMGKALIARGDHHLVVHRSGAQYHVDLNREAPVSRHRPSVDVLFKSVARSAGTNAVGVILTGMGDDGARGMLAMREAGARTIAQDEASCVVYGMPKEAVKLGGVEKSAPLSFIPRAILSSMR